MNIWSVLIGVASCTAVWVVLFTLALCKAAANGDEHIRMLQDYNRHWAGSDDEVIVVDE